MSHVATLIPSEPIIPALLINQIMAALEDASHFPTAVDWLEPRRVVDIYLGELPTEVAQHITLIAQSFAADLILQPVATRGKRMLISDMDSTMITIECIDELADYVGKKDEVAIITERAMNGELDFTAALNERVALLAGLPESTLEDCYKERVEYMPGGRELVAIMKKQGAYCLLVSGGFDFFTKRVADALGFDGELSNKLEIADGKLTGKVIPPIMDKDSKLAVMQSYSAERGIAAAEILAVGDGANDLPMLKAAGLGIAYHAKPNVRAAANHQIDYNDLSALIYAQGVVPERENDA